MKATLRSLGAILAGYLVIVLLTLLFFSLLDLALPPGQISNPWILFTLAFSVIAAVLGGWVTARLAKRHPRLHGFLLGAFLILMGLLSMSAAQGNEPFWYQASLLALALPAAWAGSALYRPRTTTR